MRIVIGGQAPETVMILIENQRVLSTDRKIGFSQSAEQNPWRLGEKSLEICFENFPYIILICLSRLSSGANSYLELRPTQLNRNYGIIPGSE